MILFDSSETDDQAEDRRLVERQKLIVDFTKIVLIADMDEIITAQIMWGGELGGFFEQNCEAMNRLLDKRTELEKIPLFQIPVVCTDEHRIRSYFSVDRDVPLNEVFMYVAKHYNEDPEREFEPLTAEDLEQWPVDAVYLPDYLAAWRDVSFWRADSLYSSETQAIKADQGVQVRAFWQAVNDVPDYKHLFPDYKPPRGGPRKGMPELVKGVGGILGGILGKPAYN